MTHGVEARNVPTVDLTALPSGGRKYESCSVPVLVPSEAVVAKKHDGNTYNRRPNTTRASGMSQRYRSSRGYKRTVPRLGKRATIPVGALDGQPGVGGGREGQGRGGGGERRQYACTH